MERIKRNWAALLFAAALIASPVLAYTQSQSVATEIASKAEKRAVSKAAVIIYEATIDGCQRDNDRARESNSRIKELQQALGRSQASRLEIVDCHKEYAPPLP